MNLTGKVAIITGASKGIGAGIAKCLAAKGAAVVVNYAASHGDAEKVVSAIITTGGTALSVQGDVRIQEHVREVFQKTIKHFGRVDILVNNAGVVKFGPAEAVTEDDFNYLFNTNVLGTVFATQEALKHFPESGGSIINISSVAGQNPGAYASTYGATKAAVDALTISYAKEFAARKIRVNTVAPGFTETEGAHSLGVFGTEMEKTMIAATPLGRFGQPDDIASVVAFLASDEAAWLTGERIRASGGLN